MSDFPAPSENAFRMMAAENVQRLSDWIASGTLSNAELTFALEAFGERLEVLAETILEHYVNDPSPLVREGAICGMHGLITWAHNARLDLAQRSRTDASPGVRAAASEAAG